MNGVEERTAKELRNLDAASAKLEAEANKLDAEAKKLEAEVRKFEQTAYTDVGKLALGTRAVERHASADQRRGTLGGLGRG